MSSSSSSAAAPAAGSSKDKIRIGSRAIICENAELRGEVQVGAGCILHPRCTIFALNGPVVLGEGCIVEETAIILNRSTEPMLIGSFNLFEVGCRVEARATGTFNTFEARSRVYADVVLGDYCTVGAGCSLYAEEEPEDADWEFVGPQDIAKTSTDDPKEPSAVPQDEAPSTSEDHATSAAPAAPDNAPDSEKTTTRPRDTTDTSLASSDTMKSRTLPIPAYTVVYGANSERRIWSGEGVGQQVALYHKHLAYLTELLPKYNKLKLIA